MSDSAPANPEVHDIVQRLDQIKVVFEDSEPFNYELEAVFVKGERISRELLLEANSLWHQRVSAEVDRVWSDAFYLRYTTHEQEWQFLAILVWEAYIPEGKWVMDRSTKKWDAKVLDVLHRFFPHEVLCTCEIKSE